MVMGIFMVVPNLNILFNPFFIVMSTKSEILGGKNHGFKNQTELAGSIRNEP